MLFARVAEFVVVVDSRRCSGRFDRGFLVEMVRENCISFRYNLYRVFTGFFVFCDSF